MTSKSITFERMFSIREAAVFLRNLAENIENTNVAKLKDIDIAVDDYQELKIGLKRHDELLMLQVKVKEMPQKMGENPAAPDLKEDVPAAPLFR